MTGRFDHVNYDKEAVKTQTDFKEVFQGLEDMVITKLCEGRSKSLVLTKIEEAYMWVGKAIRDEQVAKLPVTLSEDGGTGYV